MTRKTKHIIWGAVIILLIAMLTASLYLLWTVDDSKDAHPDKASEENGEQIDGGVSFLDPEDGEEFVSSKSDWPVYIVTMTHMEGDWEMAATNEAFFMSQVEKFRLFMDIAEEYGATLTLESEIPFAEGAVNFGVNLMQEVLDRGHGVGTHCDIGPRDEYSDFEMIQEYLKRKEPVDALVGADENLGCAGGGGQSNWYAGAVGAGFKYLGGVVGFHYLALPLDERPPGWTDREILAHYYHSAAPIGPEYHYPFLISELGFTEHPDGDLLISPGSLGGLSTLGEQSELGAQDATCKNCPLNEEDIEAAVEYILTFAQEHDGSRPGKILFYFPTSMAVEENREMLELFFHEMESLTDREIVEWTTQRGMYDVMMDYYQE